MTPVLKAITLLAIGAFGGFIASTYVVAPNPQTSWRNNRIYKAVKDELESSGIKVLHASPLTLFGDIQGYLIDLDGDGYEVLQKFEATESDDA